MGQSGHQYFSLAEVQPSQAPTEDFMPWRCSLNWMGLRCLQGNLSGQNSLQRFCKGNAMQQQFGCNNIVLVELTTETSRKWDFYLKFHLTYLELQLENTAWTCSLFAWVCCFLHNGPCIHLHPVSQNWGKGLTEEKKTSFPTPAPSTPIFHVKHVLYKPFRGPSGPPHSRETIELISNFYKNSRVNQLQQHV